MQIPYMSCPYKVTRLFSYFFLGSYKVIRLFSYLFLFSSKLQQDSHTKQGNTLTLLVVRTLYVFEYVSEL